MHVFKFSIFGESLFWSQNDQISNALPGDVYFQSHSDALPDPMSSPHPSECSHCKVSYHHQVGSALIHLGKHVHGAHPIRKGSRSNLILWCRASQDLDQLEKLPELD